MALLSGLLYLLIVGDAQRQAAPKKTTGIRQMNTRVPIEHRQKWFKAALLTG
jgi:hypothetical protein